MKKIISTFLVSMLMLFSCVGCWKQEQKMQIVSTRYLTQTVSAKQNYEIVYSATDNETNYYVLLLGSIEQTPIASGIAMAYNGRTPITYTFSEENVSGEAIEESTTKAVEESLEMGSMQSSSIEIGVGISATGPFGGATAEFKKGMEESISSNLSKGYSSSNTYTTAKSYTKGLTETLSYTIGTNLESVGKYRLALFATVDLYVVITLNVSNTQIKEISATVCARPNTYTYAIDYDENISGTFEKNSNEEMLTLSEDFYKTLAKPSLVIEKESLGKEPELKPETAYIDTVSLSCGLDNGYNYDKPSADANHKTYGHNFMLGKFVVEGGVYANNKILLVKGNKISIGFRLEYTPSSLPLFEGDGAGKRQISSDGSFSNLYDMPWMVGNRTIGQGMLVVLIQYYDGTPSEKICIKDVFTGKSQSEIINIKSGIEKACYLDIALLYELDIHVHNGLWWYSEYRNWRINQEFTIS